MTWKTRVLIPLLSLGLVSAAASTVPWEDLTESDWLYSIATRFDLVEGHQVHYPTPTAELVKALEGRQESGALRQLADAKLAMGDRAGALAAMEKWASTEGSGDAWAEAARWEASHQQLAAPSSPPRRPCRSWPTRIAAPSVMSASGGRTNTRISPIRSRCDRHARRCSRRMAR